MSRENALKSKSEEIQHEREKLEEFQRSAEEKQEKI